MKNRTNKLKLIHLGDVTLSKEIDEMINKKIEEAEEDIEAMRMQIRWDRKQIDVIKKAASLIGIPYQTYAKQTLFQQAIRDIKDAESVFKSHPTSPR